VSAGRLGSFGSSSCAAAASGCCSCARPGRRPSPPARASPRRGPSPTSDRPSALSAEARRGSKGRVSDERSAGDKVGRTNGLRRAVEEAGAEDEEERRALGDHARLDDLLRRRLRLVAPDVSERASHGSCARGRSRVAIRSALVRAGAADRKIAATYLPIRHRGQRSGCPCMTKMVESSGQPYPRAAESAGVDQERMRRRTWTTRSPADRASSGPTGSPPDGPAPAQPSGPSRSTATGRT
jgi:hypothetical protein